MHLVVVPRAGATGLIGHTGVGAVIDETEEPYLGDPGSVHRLPAAAAGTVAVTALSVLAEAVLADEEIALRVLSRRDAVAAAFEAVDGSVLVPEWPIAVAVLDDPLSLLPSTSMIQLADRLHAVLREWNNSK